jgi:hypothetical protein
MEPNRENVPRKYILSRGTLSDRKYPPNSEYDFLVSPNAFIAVCDSARRDASFVEIRPIRVIRVPLAVNAAFGRIGATPPVYQGISDRRFALSAMTGVLLASHDRNTARDDRNALVCRASRSFIIHNLNIELSGLR